jgi:hypothetical protein
MATKASRNMNTLALAVFTFAVSHAAVVQLAAAEPVNVAAVATLAARPAALAAFDALPLADVAAKAARLGTTPTELRELIQTSAAVTFDADFGSLEYR